MGIHICICGHNRFKTKYKNHPLSKCFSVYTCRKCGKDIEVSKREIEEGDKHG